MKKALPIERIKVGEIGTIDIEIPILRIGGGKPKVSIVCGLHGDETTGLFVIDKLLRNLELKKGQLLIVLAANQLAQALKRREAPLDFKDLNRIFPGSPNGSFSERIVDKLSNLLADSDVMLDFHTFGMETKMTGILPAAGEMGRKALQFLELFNPSVVWKVVFDGEEEKYTSALGPHLSRIGVPNIAIEFPDMINATDKDIEDGVNGLNNLLKGLGMVDGKPKRNKQTLLLRKVVLAENSGLFIPKAKVMTDVKKGDVIGELVRMNGEFSRKTIPAEQDGKLIQINKKTFVNTGEDLFALGLPV
jgi:predicted deacylase